MNGWRHEPFDNVIADESGGNLKTPQSEFLPSGRYAIVDQGKELVAGYTNDESRLCRAQLPVIVFGDHTRCFKYVDFPFCMGADGVKVLRPKVEADVKYLYHYLRQLRLTAGGYDRHFKYLKRTSVALPRIPEQRRIVEILDKADALRAKRRAALAQLDTLTQSIFLDMFSDPATNPKGWPEVSIGDHTSKIGSGATPRGGEESYKAAGITLIRSMNVRDGTFLKDGLAFIDDEQAAQLEGVVVEADDVLLNITGASVARVCRAPADVLPARVNQHVAIIRPTATFNSHFLEQCLLSPSVKERLLKIARAGATREAITKSAIEQFKVIRPPRELQNLFSARVDASEGVHRRMRTAISEIESLCTSLQHRAFRGEL
jgi:type I restriction enzyme S subunit